MVDKSEAAYFEAGYFLIYGTLRGWRLGLGLSINQTTARLYSTQLILIGTLVGYKVGQPFDVWTALGLEQQAVLMETCSNHMLGLSKRTQWYEQFPPPADTEDESGTLMWEFTEQIGRSTNHVFAGDERERFIAATAVCLHLLDGQTLAQTVESD